MLSPFRDPPLACSLGGKGDVMQKNARLIPNGRRICAVVFKIVLGNTDINQIFYVLKIDFQAEGNMIPMPVL